MPSRFTERPYHAHNRLLASVTSDGATRREIARAIGEKLAAATGPTAFILPVGGIQQWDQDGEPLYEPEALSDFVEEMRINVPKNAELHEIAGHINDASFSAKALEIFDRWVAEGIVPPGASAGRRVA